MTFITSFQNGFLTGSKTAAPTTVNIGDARCQLEYVDGITWDQIAAQFDDVVHEQTHFFNTLRWGENKVENVIFRVGDKIVGGASVIIIPIPLSTTGLAIVKWGPLWRKHGHQPNLADLKSMLHLLQKEFADVRGFYLTIMPHADPEYSKDICDHLKALRFKTGATLPAPERYLVNVDQSVDDLRKSLDQKWRYNLKKAEKNNFEIEFSTRDKAFDDFIDLYAKMLDRKQFMDTSAIHTLKALMQNGNEALRPSIVLVSHNDKVIAGGVFDLSGERATYLYGASDNQAVSLKAGYAMHWWIASHLCTLPHNRMYDLGGNDGDRGLHQFKKGFVGKTGSICQTPPAYHYASNRRARLLGRAIFQAKELKSSLLPKIHALKVRLMK